MSHPVLDPIQNQSFRGITFDSHLKTILLNSISMLVKVRSKLQVDFDKRKRSVSTFCSSSLTSFASGHNFTNKVDRDGEN